MASVMKELILVDKDKNNLTKEVETLENDVQEKNSRNAQMVEDYENILKKLHNDHRSKLKETIDIFENFLQNNPELLSSDLYTVYRNLKKK